ncbi:hypothetical protein Tco_0439770 [Tanacetum coccineum]
MNEAILASSSEVPSILEFLQRRKLEAKKERRQEVAASEFSHLNHSLSHRPVSVKPDISKASSAGGKLHILKPSCERNVIRIQALAVIGGLQIQAPLIMISLDDIFPRKVYKLGHEDEDDPVNVLPKLDRQVL